jgi:hypothetical protein
MTVKGMLTSDELARLVDTGEIDTVVVGFSDHYGRLCGKRFDAEFFIEDVVDHGTHGCDYLLTTDMEMEPVPGYEFANWELGYGDMHMVADMSTLRRASWLDRAALVLCDLETTAGEPVRPPASAPWRPPSSSTTCSTRRTAMQRPPASATATSTPRAGTSRTTSCNRAPAPSRSPPRRGGT